MKITLDQKISLILMKDNNKLYLYLDQKDFFLFSLVSKDLHYVQVIDHRSCCKYHLKIL